MKGHLVHSSAKVQELKGLVLGRVGLLNQRKATDARHSF